MRYTADSLTSLVRNEYLEMPSVEEIAQALAADPSGTAIVEELLRSPHPELRFWVLSVAPTVLARDRFKAALKEMLNDRDEGVRSGLLRFSGRLTRTR